MLYHRVGRDDLAIPSLRKAVQIRPDVFEAVFNLGVIERDQSFVEDAHRHLTRATLLQPNSASAHAMLGALSLDRGKLDAARSSFERALKLDPDCVATRMQVAQFYSMIGDRDLAAKHYEEVISRHPLRGDAHYGIAHLQKFTGPSDDIGRMEEAFSAVEISEEDRILTGFALGKVFDDLNDYGKAFEFFLEANRLQRKTIRYSNDEQKKIFDRHKKALGRSLVEHCRSHSIPDDTLILILGMPRSGTSLVEQILASHPAVYGAGEVEYSRHIAEQVRMLTGRPFPQNIESVSPERLRDFAISYIDKIKAHAGTAARVCDKLPHNFLRIGLFVALMPNAKIVLCNRDPLDNCLSIYQHNFSSDHGYACDLAILGRYYRLYENLMSFWEEQFPGHVYRIEYEDLVHSTESQVRKLLEYCGLSFHEACLSFHDNSRTVRTPSASQVRQAIYTDAVGRARNYEPYLKPLIQALSG